MTFLNTIDHQAMSLMIFTEDGNFRCEKHVNDLDKNQQVHVAQLKSKKTQIQKDIEQTEE
ncbi:hypothetical protein QQ008_11455 [Fulvivirgaceae bacterium BMA10]|uniref:Uncharacterized protein n=1 Tax=Splendidivirga corallicola TaxID=3051826 RepID=A0ABT8KMK8_9BACT|nr:hypothetical protein [Fulvivirgaceae bacterium BMA10]